MDKSEEFTVRDRRSSSRGPESDTAAKAHHEKVDVSAGESSHDEAETPGSIDFSAFVLSLATSAQISLGNVPHPELHQTATDLPAAQQMIDILGLLKEKTRGNLTREEDALLDQVLFNLRMHYARSAEGQKKSGGA